jgi:putative ATP-binding cassette transporter
MIVGGLLILVVGQTWLQETIKVVLRASGSPTILLDKWLAPKRPYLLAHAGEVGRQSGPVHAGRRPPARRS